MAKEPTRTLRITFKDSEEGHAERDHHITMINNYLKLKNEHDTLFYLLQKGIAVTLEEIAKGPNSTPEVKMAAAIQKKLIEYQRKEAQWASLNKLYDSMSSDDFQKWCDEFGVDINLFQEWRDRKANDSWADKVRKWLNDLLRDGNPVQTDAIKAMALEAGIIIPELEKQQWQYINVLAGREGFTGSTRGCWQRKNIDPSF
jgi:hypothetical protein